MWMLETSIEGVCCLKIPEISKEKFSSVSCFNVCRSDPHFVLWYSRQENFLSYLISCLSLSLANQNKSFLSLQTLQLSFSVKQFTLLFNQIFFFIRDVICEHIFSKEHPNGFRGSVIIEKQYLIWIAGGSHSQLLENLLNGGKLYEIHFLWIWKCRTSIFWSTSEGLLLNIPEKRSSLFSISHFSSLETECVEATVCSCFSK